MRLTINFPTIPEKAEDDYDLAKFKGLVMEAHLNEGSRNMEVSNAVFLNTVQGSHSFRSGLVAAISSFGGSHGPVSGARAVFLTATREGIEQAKASGRKIPGYGTAFKEDTSWDAVSAHVHRFYPEDWSRIEEINEWIGKPVKPNACMFTALLCEKMEIPVGTEDLLLILARIPVWTGLLSK